MQQQKKPWIFNIENLFFGLFPWEEVEEPNYNDALINHYVRKDNALYIQDHMCPPNRLEIGVCIFCCLFCIPLCIVGGLCFGQNMACPNPPEHWGVVVMLVLGCTFSCIFCLSCAYYWFSKYMYGILY